VWFRNEEVCMGGVVGGGRCFRGAGISGDEFAGIGCEPSFSRNADGQIGVDAGRRGIVRAGGAGRIAEEVIPERFSKQISGMEQGSFAAGLRCRAQSRSLRILPALSASSDAKLSPAISEISSEKRSSRWSGELAGVSE